MKEKIIKFINRIYFGIYLYTRELDIPVTWGGRKNYYRGHFGSKICALLVMFYANAFLSFIGILGGKPLLTFVKGLPFYKYLYIVLLVGLCLFIIEVTSLEGDKGLSYFEQFDQEPRSTKIKWMIYGALALVLGAILCALGCIGIIGTGFDSSSKFLED